MTEGIGATLEIAATDAYRSSIEATVADASHEGIVLDRTVFYPRGGGQPGDKGVLRWSGGDAIVTDTVRSIGRVVHVIHGDRPATGSGVSAEIDWERR